MADPENYDDFGSMILKFQSSLTAMNKMNQQVHDLYDLLMRVNDTMNDTEFYMENLFKQQVPNLGKAISSLSKAEKKFDGFNYKMQRKTAGAKQGAASVQQTTDIVLADTESKEPEPWQQELQSLKEQTQRQESETGKQGKIEIGEEQQLQEKLRVLTAEFHAFQTKTEIQAGALHNENNVLKERISKMEQMMS